jgi:hypothetical protein
LVASLGPPAAVDTEPDELELPDEVEPEPEPNPDDPDDLNPDDPKPDEPKPDEPEPDDPDDPKPEPDVPDDPTPEPDDPKPEEVPDPADPPAAGAAADATAWDEPVVSCPTTTPTPAMANTPTVAAAIRPGLRRRRWSIPVAHVPATGPSSLIGVPRGTQASGWGGRFDSCSMVQPP